MAVRIAGSRFVDDEGRTLILRGVNVGGSSKVPRHPDGATHRREGFFEHRSVSFVGRPFPLEEADEHFSRLRAWGLTFLRLLVTWEAIEHEGPGRYDEAYLDYVRALVERAGRQGLQLFIDPHQDMWSRFSGGDGAPGWTLEAAGFDVTRLAEVGAAVLHQLQGGPLPPMAWVANETRLAAATLFTLFFAGNHFAPAVRVDGEPIQDYLQRHYVAAFREVARRLHDLPWVVGYDTMNEPLPGYIGWPDLRVAGGMVRIGPCPTPFQAMLLGAGHPQVVETWKAGATGFRRTGKELLNAGRERAWRPGCECVWRRSGVWDLDGGGEPRLLAPDHFARVDGRPVDFSQDCYLPFARRFAEAIREVHPGAALFVETATNHPPPRWSAPGIAYAPHWYDGFVVFLKRYSRWVAVDARSRRLVFTPWAIRRSFATQLAALRDEGRERLGGAPTLIGELGIAFDLRGTRRDGDLRVQTRALDRTLRALDDALLGGTLWNYTADHSEAHGDQWNGEDFSIFSPDRLARGRDAGGRALDAAVRPCARAVAGEPLHMHFDLRRRRFELTFRHDPRISAPTEIFVPRRHYPDGYRVQVSDGTSEAIPDRQILAYRHGAGRQVHTVRIRPAPRRG